MGLIGIRCESVDGFKVLKDGPSNVSCKKCYLRVNWI